MPATAKVQSDIVPVCWEPAAADVDQEQVESDVLLVRALTAVAQLRDTVDRIVVFDHLKRLLEHDQRALDQTIANDQGTLDELIRERQARLNELRARREHLLRTLRPT